MNTITLIDNKKHSSITIYEDTDNELYTYMIESYDRYFEPVVIIVPEPVEVPEVPNKPYHETLWGRFPTFHWPTDYVSVNQAFGVNVQYYSQWSLPGHEGIDMKAHHDTPIACVWDGVVSRVGTHTAYGNEVRVKHTIDGNKYESVYAHFNRWADIEVGDEVTRGQLLGYADSTGNSTGSHLHISLKQFFGEKPKTPEQVNKTWPYDIIDPTPFFKELI